MKAALTSSVSGASLPDMSAMSDSLVSVEARNTISSLCYAYTGKKMFLNNVCFFGFFFTKEP